MTIIEIGDRVRTNYENLEEIGTVRHKFVNASEEFGTYTQCYIELDEPLKVITKLGNSFLDHLTIWEGFCEKI